MPTITAQGELPKTAPVAPEAQAPAEASQPEVKEEALSPKFAALVKKEKQLRAWAEKVKSQAEQIKSQEDKYKTDYAPDKFIAKDKLKSDWLNMLLESGETVESLAQVLLDSNHTTDPAVKAMQAKISELENSQKTAAQQAEEQKKAQYEQAVNQIRNQTKLLVDSDERFETIKETGHFESVVEHIKQTFDQDGILLDVEEAAQEVEDALVEEALKLTSLKKIKSKLSPEQSVVDGSLDPKPAPTAPKQAPQQLKTLTNAVSATAKPMSAKERRERAILAFKGQL